MIDGIDQALTNDFAAAQTGFGALDSEVFLQLLVSQLQNQNPLEPMDASAMLQQTAQFANVEAIQRQTELSGQLLGYQQFSAATTLIGRHVVAFDPIVGEISGEVTGVRTTIEGPMLQLGDVEVALTGIISVDANARGARTASPESPDTPESAADPESPESISPEGQVSP